MKTAIYVKEGFTQIVLTPENAFEQEVVRAASRTENAISIHRGQFYDCHGGWIREGSEDESLLIGVSLKDEAIRA